MPLGLVVAIGLWEARQAIRRNVPHFPSASDLASAVRQVLPAPGSPGPSDQAPAGSTPLVSSKEMEEISKLQAVVDGRDETALREEFGLLLMMDLNIGIVRDRLVHFRQTGSNSLSLLPYLDGGRRQMLLDTDIAKVFRDGGDGGYVPQPGEVGLIVLPEEYSAGKQTLLGFEKSSVLPSPVVAAVKDLDDAVTQNAKTLIKVLNEALHANPDYFLHYDDMSSPYLHEVRSMYFSRLIQLEPKAEEVTSRVRESLGVR
jgi:hypothetical protein